MKLIGTNISLYRNFHRLTHGHLAKHLNVPINQIESYELGEKTPTILELNELSDLFGIEIWDFLTPTADMDEDTCIAELNNCDDESLRQIAKMNKVVKNYLKMCFLMDKFGLEEQKSFHDK